MIQGCENFSFTHETADAVCVARELIWQNFDRNVALQFRIACAIDLAHSALAQKSRNFERAKSCTYFYRHGDITETQYCLARHYAEKRQRKQTQQRRQIK